MTRFSTLGLFIVSAWLLTNACGGRTATSFDEGDDRRDGSAGDGFGSGGSAASSGSGGSQSGASGTGARAGTSGGPGGGGAAGFSGAPAGSSGIGGFPGGFGGTGARGGFGGTGARGGFGGVPGGFGGGGMTGGGFPGGPECGIQPDCFSACVCETRDPLWCASACSGTCTPPQCGNCLDCFDGCYCATGDPRFCEQTCFGMGGAGGVPGFCGACPSIVVSPGAPEFTGCCLNDFECGVESPALEILGLSGCVSIDRLLQPGQPDPSCPNMVNPLGLPGCCMTNGACGIDFGELGMGCLPGPEGGRVRCGLGAGGAGGVPATGGAAGVPTTGGAAGADPVSQCVSQARNECEACACGSCFESLLPCFADAGCPAILQCANRTGCTGVDCFQPNTCMAVIDQYGGFGSQSTQLAIPLFGCLQSSGCPCGFGG